jgi:hypothetical protein
MTSFPLPSLYPVYGAGPAKQTRGCEHEPTPADTGAGPRSPNLAGTIDSIVPADAPPDLRLSKVAGALRSVLGDPRLPSSVHRLQSEDGYRTNVVTWRQTAPSPSSPWCGFLVRPLRSTRTAPGAW